MLHFYIIRNSVSENGGLSLLHSTNLHLRFSSVHLRTILAAFWFQEVMLFLRKNVVWPFSQNNGDLFSCLLCILAGRHFEGEKFWATFQAYKLRMILRFVATIQDTDICWHGVNLFENCSWHSDQDWYRPAVRADHQFCHVFFFCCIPGFWWLRHLIHGRMNLQLHQMLTGTPSLPLCFSSSAWVWCWYLRENVWLHFCNIFCCY